MSQLPQNINWGHLGVRSIAQFETMNPVTYALQQVAVDQGDGTAVTYLSNGLVWQPLGGTLFASSGGLDYIVGPGGVIIPLTAAVGTYAQMLVAGTKQATIELDSGNDANPHNNWGLTYDCTLAGQPGVPHDSMAADRFVRANPNEIIISGLPGNVMAGIVYFPEFNTLSMVHVAQLGGSTYPNSGTATAGLNQLVRLDCPEGTIALEIQAREPTGANGRKRQIVFTPFLART